MNTKIYNSETLARLLEKAKNLVESLSSQELGHPLYINCDELEESIKIYSAESFKEFLPGSLILIGKVSYMKVANGTWVCQTGRVYASTEFFSLFVRTLSQTPIPSVRCPFFGEEPVHEVEKVEEDPSKELDSLEELAEKNGGGIPIWWGDEAYMVTSPADLNLVVWSHFEDSKRVNYTRKRSTDGTLIWTLSSYECDSSLGGELEKVLSNTELFELMVKRFYEYGETYHCPRPLVKSSSPSS